MLAQDAMKNFIDSEETAAISIERITRNVADEYGLSVEEIKSKNNAQTDCAAASGRDVFVQKIDPSQFPGDRTGVRREASYDGYALS